MFFSRGMSLEAWHRAGILDRELALYRRLAPGLERLAFVTYGNADDHRFAADLPGLDVLPNLWRLPSNVYSVLAPILHRKYLRAASVFRTNQVNGGWCAVIAHRLFGKPLIVRCGFLWADNVDRLTTNPLRRAIARGLERRVFRAGDRVVVASAEHAHSVVEQYGVSRDRLTVIPNYVDTSRFRPDPQVPRERGHVVFVGRLEPEKRVDVLIDAIAAAPDLTLTVAGDGTRREGLQARARAAGASVAFVGRLEQSALATLLNRAHVLALPSAYEGQPKVILEAMASGLPVIGTRVAGIRDVIDDGRTGVLCGSSAAEIRAALVALVGDTARSERLAAAALDDVGRRCSLAAVVEREQTVLASLAPSI